MQALLPKNTIILIPEKTQTRQNVNDDKIFYFFRKIKII